MTDEATTLDAGDATAALDTGVAEALSDGDNLDLDTGLAAEEGADQATTEGDGPAEEIEEIELDGKKYEVPKEVKRAILRNEDYTRKTQELAEQRRVLETQATEFQHATQAVNEKQVDLAIIDKQLTAYKALDWRGLFRDDPAYAAEEQFAYNELKDRRAAVAEELDGARRQAALDADRLVDTRLQEGLQQLVKDIPGFNAELAGKLQAFGAETYGFTRDELGEVKDPRLIRLLHAAYAGSDALKRQKDATRIKAAQATTPATSVRGAGGRYSVAADTNDYAAFDKMADGILAKK